MNAERTERGSGVVVIHDAAEARHRRLLHVLYVIAFLVFLHVVTDVWDLAVWIVATGH